MRLVIFDLDGTLLDTYGTIRSNLNWTLRRLGRKLVSLSAVRRAVGLGPRQLLAQFVGPADLPEALRLFHLRYERNLSRGTRVYAGVRRTLKQLRDSGYRLALASNKPSAYTGPLLKRFGLDDYFDAVLCGDEVVWPKPHPMMLRKILKRLGCPASRALFVGDMTIDCVTGRRAGVRTVCVLTGGHRRAELMKEKPLMILKNVSELISLLRKG